MVARMWRDHQGARSRDLFHGFKALVTRPKLLTTELLQGALRPECALAERMMGNNQVSAAVDSRSFECTFVDLAMLRFHEDVLGELPCDARFGALPSLPHLSR